MRHILFIFVFFGITSAQTEMPQDTTAVSPPEAEVPEQEIQEEAVPVVLAKIDESKKDEGKKSRKWMYIGGGLVLAVLAVAALAGGDADAPSDSGIGQPPDWPDI